MAYRETRIRKNNGETSVEERVDELMSEMNGKPSLTLPLKTVRAEIVKKFKQKNGDVEIVDDKLSLLDPNTKVRIRIPARGKYCEHFRCFDLRTFLTSNLSKEEKSKKTMGKGAWPCPICKCAITQEQLCTDEYFAKILEMTPGDCSEVELLPDGSWQKTELPPEAEYKDIPVGESGEVSLLEPRKKRRKKDNGNGISSGVKTTENGESFARISWKTLGELLGVEKGQSPVKAIQALKGRLESAEKDSKRLNKEIKRLEAENKELAGKIPSKNTLELQNPRINLGFETYIDRRIERKTVAVQTEISSSAQKSHQAIQCELIDPPPEIPKKMTIETQTELLGSDIKEKSIVETKDVAVEANMLRPVQKSQATQCQLEDDDVFPHQEFLATTENSFETMLSIDDYPPISVVSSMDEEVEEEQEKETIIVDDDEDKRTILERTHFAGCGAVINRRPRNNKLFEFYECLMEGKEFPLQVRDVGCQTEPQRTRTLGVQSSEAPIVLDEHIETVAFVSGKVAKQLDAASFSALKVIPIGDRQVFDAFFDRFHLSSMILPPRFVIWLTSLVLRSVPLEELKSSLSRFLRALDEKLIEFYVYVGAKSPQGEEIFLLAAEIPSTLPSAAISRPSAKMFVSNLANPDFAYIDGVIGQLCATGKTTKIVPGQGGEKQKSQEPIATNKFPIGNNTSARTFEKPLKPGKTKENSTASAPVPGKSTLKKMPIKKIRVKA